MMIFVDQDPLIFTSKNAPHANPDVTMWTDVRTLQEIVNKTLSVEDALESERITFMGPEHMAKGILRLISQLPKL